MPLSGPAPRLQDDDPLVGTTLPGGHRIVELIDTGGMGRVYRAEQTALGRTVAVKVIHPHLSGDETIEARFITEARAASQLNHPNSVNVIDFGADQGRLYLVMEFLRGRELSTVLADDGLLPEPRIADLLGQVLAALDEAHHLGIVHRDLKPENIILQSLRSGGDFVKVVDFGLAIVRAQTQHRRVTLPGLVCGTPHYMAPEQARGDNTDGRADLYACGVILYELLTGQPPFDANSPAEVVAMQLHDPPRDPRQVAPDRHLEDETIDLVMRALAKQPSERFQTARDFADALRISLGETPPATARHSGRRVRCPKCRSLVVDGQKFCGNCGGSMSKPPSAPPGRGSALAATQPRMDSQAPAGELAEGELVGRSRELDWLLAFSLAAPMQCSSCRVVGTVGAGKSRLLAELAGRLQDEGDVVVRVQPDPWRAQVGSHALQQLIAQLAEFEPTGPEPADLEAASDQVRAGLSSLFSMPAAGGLPASSSWPDRALDPHRHLVQRERAAASLDWAIGCAQERASSGRVSLLVDDAHAIDSASLAVLATFVESLAPRGVLLVAAHEPRFELGWAQVETLELEGLTAADGARLLEAVPASLPPGASPARDDDGARVLPLYVEQLMRFVAEGGAEPPPGLADLLALRIERLSLSSRRVLQAVAVLGDEAPELQVAALVPDVSQVDRELAELTRVGMLARVGEELSVHHPLVRDVTLLGMPAEVRRRLHRRARHNALVGELLIPIEAQARHALCAEDAFEALMLLEQVATRAIRRGDVDGAVRVLREGLELARQEMSRGQLDDPLGAVLHFSRKLGDALTLRGDLVQADGVLREALDLGGPRAVQRPRLLTSLAMVARERQRHDAALSLLGEAQGLAEDRGEGELSAALERLRMTWAD